MTPLYMLNYSIKFEESCYLTFYRVTIRNFFTDQSAAGFQQYSFLTALRASFGSY